MLQLLPWAILQFSAQWPGLWMEARLEVTMFWYRPPCFCCVNQVVVMLTGIWMKKQVCIKARSTPVSPPFKDQVTEHTTVKWPINLSCEDSFVCLVWSNREMSSLHVRGFAWLRSSCLPTEIVNKISDIPQRKQPNKLLSGLFYCCLPARFLHPSNCTVQ